ncbi:50S ribosomal protein L29 [Candidatus Jorgensenbacteria bacterium RIFCSPLOWO2_12_FULL_42_11]|uniref:Large ribosomal subunit protein uL29 n=1 Tax=Candidatus Jorgensenbacteria bacterium RIFCSPLOWO2_12_FULL_42_11 TaxID=1798473 RepID=A0A1F6C1L4_9BACT|nr:MAG: 50S ribosomal protein L29 [Candidatus Jorgensenbacteria bacterium RIFCSPLOWO2_12_FULL_42_11]
MKKKNFQEIKNKPVAELQKELVGYRERFRVLKFDLAAGKVKNIREIKEVKKTIAQILTIINNKESRK